jgi:hypothetical protein
VLVQAQVRHQLLQPGILIPQLPQFAKLGNAQVPVELLSPVEGLLCHLELPADLQDLGPVLHLLQGEDDLFL